MAFYVEVDMCWNELEVEVGMALAESRMMWPVKVSNVMVGMVEEVLDEIEGCKTLLDKLGDLKSPHYAIQN